MVTKMPKGRGRKGNAPPRKKKKKEVVVTRKLFTEFLNEAASDEDDLPNTDNESTNTTVDEGINLVNTTGQPSVSYHSQGNVYHFGNTGVVTGGVHTNQETIFLPQEPPPLACVSAESLSATSDTNPFILTVVTGSISVCRGCRQRYMKPAVPPLDLCIRHKEWQEFIDPTGHSQQRFGNVYYHCNAPCILAHCPTFSDKDLQIDPKMGTLTEVHLKFLKTHARTILVKIWRTRLIFRRF